MYSRSQASTRTEAPGKPVAFDTASAAAETVERAKVAVGRGWEIVRNINWRDGTRKEPESNGARMWGRLLEATNTARQKVADKYYEVREGGNGLFPFPASVCFSANCQQSPTTTPRTIRTPNACSRSTTSPQRALSPPGCLPLPPSLPAGTQVITHQSHQTGPAVRSIVTLEANRFLCRTSMILRVQIRLRSVSLDQDETTISMETTREALEGHPQQGTGYAVNCVHQT